MKRLWERETTDLIYGRGRQRKDHLGLTSLFLLRFFNPPEKCVCVCVCPYECPYECVCARLHLKVLLRLHMWACVFVCICVVTPGPTPHERTLSDLWPFYSVAVWLFQECLNVKLHPALPPPRPSSPLLLFSRLEHCFWTELSRTLHLCTGDEEFDSRSTMLR